MAKITLSIRCPQGWAAASWYNFNVKLMKVLHETHELIEDDEACNWKLDEFLNIRHIKDIAAFVFGNDLPATVELVKGLVIVGDGDCPECGSNNRTEILGGYQAARFEGDSAGWVILGHKCNNCKHEDYRE